MGGGWRKAPGVPGLHRQGGGPRRPQAQTRHPGPLSHPTPLLTGWFWGPAGGGAWPRTRACRCLGTPAWGWRRGRGLCKAGGRWGVFSSSSVSSSGVTSRSCSSRAAQRRRHLQQQRQRQQQQRRHSAGAAAASGSSGGAHSGSSTSVFCAALTVWVVKVGEGGPLAVHLVSVHLLPLHLNPAVLLDAWQ